MTDFSDKIFNEQWDKVYELISNDKTLISEIDSYDITCKRFYYGLVENGKEEYIPPFGQFSDLLKVVDACVNNGMKGKTIPQATAFQQIDQIKELLDHGHNIDEQDFGERTGLLVAAALNDFELVKFFVDNGAFVSFYDQDNLEAIDLTNSIEILDILAKNNGKTKQQRADDYDEYCIARESLNLHREANLKFIRAAKEGDLVKMQEALTNSTMPTITINHTDYESGNTALHYAVQNNDSNSIKFLTLNRIDTEKTNKQGITAKELALKLGYNDLFI